MTWENMSRLLEASDRTTPTEQIKQINRALTVSFTDTNDKISLLRILAQDYPTNNIGVSKAIKWMASIFDLFNDEMKSEYETFNDLGDAVYHLQSSAEKTNDYTLTSIVRLLTLDCSKIDSVQKKLIAECVLSMSSQARKWFIRYWLRTPRNGINEGVVAKIIAKHYGKKIGEVKKHLNFNSIEVVVNCYSIDTTPACNLVHGKFVKPMLAKEVPMNKWPENRIVDFKYDGNRYQIHKEKESVIIFNRKGNIVTEQFSDVVESVRNYEIESCILDGEIYPINDDGSPAEHKLMATRVHSKNHAEARERVKVKWVIFDCLKFNHNTIMDLPYWQRIDYFNRLPDQAHRMDRNGDTLAFYNQAINLGFEGIIVKDSNMSYEPGKRSIGWAKYKPPRIELDVVILSAKYGEGKRANVFGTFEIGVKSENGYVSVGQVGTGFSDADLVSLTNQLRMNIEEYSDGVYRFLPRVVLEVSADLVSRDKDGNIGLRFPRCNRIRSDKFASDANTLDDVEALE